MIHKWHKKYFKDFLSKNIEKIIAWFLWILLVFFWNYYSGDSWEWKNIEPIKITVVTYWISAVITFFTTGALFYFLRVYQLLHIIFVRFLWLKKLYNDIKYFIWIALNLITLFIILPVIIAFLNIICSIFYNIYTLLYYLFPSILIVLTIIGLYYLYLFLKTKKQLFK